MKQENGNYLSQKIKNSHSLSKFDELSPGMGFPSLRASFASAPYDGMDKIIQYLEAGKVMGGAFKIARDAFTGEKIPGEFLCMTDGEYSWNSSIPYYVRKYNLRLPREFEEKVLKSFNEE